MLFSGPILPKLHALDSRTQSSTRPTMAIRNFPFKLGSVAGFAFGMDAVGRGLLPSATFIAAQALSSELRSSGTIKGATWTSFVANHGCAKQKVRLLHPRVHTESDVDVICRRLSRHLARLRSEEPDSIAQTDPDELEPDPDDHEADMDDLGADEDDIGLGLRDRQRIRHRAKRIVAGRRFANRESLGHLSSNRDKRDRTALLQLAGMVPVKAIAGEATADELAASLHAEFPWMGAATTVVWHALQRCARAGRPICVGPLLVHGPAGIGKTAWANGLSKVLNLPHCVIDAGQGLSSMILAGTERGWSGEQPGRPLQTVISSRIANPVIVVEEVDKACVLRTNSGVSLAFESALLGLLEPGSAPP